MKVPLKSLAEGISFVWKNKVSLGAMALDMFAVLLGGAKALLPVFAQDILGVGPFALRAGDTTEFIWFVGRATDTLSYKALVGAVTETYMSNFRDAQPIALPVFAASDVHVTAASQRDTGQEANVRIQLRMPPREPAGGSTTAEPESRYLR